ncbi:hypothetical protein J26TS2_31340 [Shouchella clausii]|nr:hypothetical protein J26TS2_31340 [Shouchella clausii]
MASDLLIEKIAITVTTKVRISMISTTSIVEKARMNPARMGEIKNFEDDAIPTIPLALAYYSSVNKSVIVAL